MKVEFWAKVEGFGGVTHAWKDNAPLCVPDYDGVSPFHGAVLHRERPDASACCTKCGGVAQ